VDVDGVHAALAGLRVGFGAFPLSLVDYLWRAKQPYNVSVAAEVAACAALTNSDYMKKVCGCRPSCCLVTLCPLLLRATRCSRAYVYYPVLASCLCYCCQVRDVLVSERDRLYEQLQSIPFLEPYPSHANFVLAKVRNNFTQIKSYQPTL
jgi:histidinol-phosphate aminotransferase